MESPEKPASMHYIVLLLIFFTFTRAELSIGAENSFVFVPQGEHKQTLAGQLDYLEDQDEILTIDQVANEYTSSFRKLDKSKQFGYAYKYKVLWIRFAVDLRKHRDPYWFLSYDYEHIGNLKVFYPVGTGFKTIEMDEKFPSEGRLFNIREYIFKLPTPETAPTYYYVRLPPNSRYLKVDLSWSGTKGLLESLQYSEMAYGLFFGALLVMWLYNFALYAFLKDRAYLYYTYYLGCFTAVFFHIYGFSPYIFRLTPFYEQVFAACGYGAIHGMVLFARHFLALKTSIRWMDQYLAVFQAALLVGGIAAFFQPVGQPFIYLNYLILLVLPVMMLAGATRWYQGYAPARVYSMGWIVFAAALGILSLRSVGLLPSNIITNHAVMVASVWEAIIFSIALAYRIKLIEKEKNTALDERAKRELELVEGERDRLEQRVAERTESLRASLEARRMMLANASHELRSPVNALRLLLDSSSANTTEEHKIIPNVAAITAHMSQLVENLLLLDTEQPAKQGGLVQDFDLGEEIRATATMLGPLRHGSLATFTIDVEACVGMMVRGDLTSLRRIIINLLSNAFKFTETGSVSLQARTCDTIQQGKIAVTIRVSDTGLGIPASMHDQIFDAFVTTGIQGKHTGTGLGLAISRQLALNLEGSLSLIKSDVNAGSEFELQASFAVVSAKILKSEVTDDHLRSDAPPRRFKVLVAEDDPITAKAVQIIIRQLHHEVAHVATYGELYQALSETSPPFDVALIDHRLPGGSGFEAIKKCRNLGIAPATRMILVTADVTPEVLEAAKTICDDIVTKPTSAFILRKLLGSGLRLRPSLLGPREIVDSGPLTMLSRCGAEQATLAKMCDAFSAAAHGALEQIKVMFETHDTPPSNLTSLGNIVHRIRSSCSTIGAVALDIELQKLAACENRLAIEKQYAIVVEVLTSTQEALRKLLSKTETYDPFK